MRHFNRHLRFHVATTLFAITANAQVNPVNGVCEVEAEGLLKTGGAYTQPAELVASGVKFEIFHIRTVLHGGEALSELVVSKQGCKWVAQQTVWSE